MGRSPSSLVTRPQELRVEALQPHRRVLQVAFPEPSKAPRCRAMSCIWTLGIPREGKTASGRLSSQRSPCHRTARPHLQQSMIRNNEPWSVRVGIGDPRF